MSFFQYSFMFGRAKGKTDLSRRGSAVTGRVPVPLLMCVKYFLTVFHFGYILHLLSERRSFPRERAAQFFDNSGQRRELRE